MGESSDFFDSMTQLGNETRRVRRIAFMRLAELARMSASSFTAILSCYSKQHGHVWQFIFAPVPGREMPDQMLSHGL